MDEEKQDVWEEEIDLREVARGIGRMWYVWIGIPLVVTVLTGVYLIVQPDQYEVSVSGIRNMNVLHPKKGFFKVIE